MMTLRERILRVLRFQSYDRLPVIHFGFWSETWQQWEQNGELPEAFRAMVHARAGTEELARALGFDGGYADQTLFAPDIHLDPPFESRVLRTRPDGSREVLKSHGVVVLERAGAGSIPSEVEHLLKDRASWEGEFLPRLRFKPERVAAQPARGERCARLPFAEAVPVLRAAGRDALYGLYCGSMIGIIRSYLGVENLAYLQVDDPGLFVEMVTVHADLCFRCVQAALAAGVPFDYAHFWEDICFKNGPLISPRVFEDVIGPQYQRITDLLRAHGITIVSVDCDGLIDALIPTWLRHGVNTMFPVEVGTWNASIAPWRKRYGHDLRAVGGMNKTVFAKDHKAVDEEIARLKPLVALGGYLPCPDHRIPPDAKFELVRYYTQRMREVFA